MCVGGGMPGVGKGAWSLGRTYLDRGSLLSPVSDLAGLRSPVISIEPPSSTVQQGQDASFKCLIHEGATPIKVEWKIRDQELEGECLAAWAGGKGKDHPL